MSVTVKELRAWLRGAKPSLCVAVDDGGLGLVMFEEGQTFDRDEPGSSFLGEIEIGGVPLAEEDEP